MRVAARIERQVARRCRAGCAVTRCRLRCPSDRQSVPPGRSDRAPNSTGRGESLQRDLPNARLKGVKAIGAEALPDRSISQANDPCKFSLPSSCAVYSARKSDAGEGPSAPLFLRGFEQTLELLAFDGYITRRATWPVLHAFGGGINATKTERSDSGRTLRVARRRFRRLCRVREPRHMRPL